MPSRKCPICKELLTAPLEVPAHPTCMADHPEFVPATTESVHTALKADELPKPTRRKSNDSENDWMQQFEKEFGGGIIKTGDDLSPVAYRGSGSIALDVALGGGWPCGRVIDVIGREGAGKTRLFELAAIEAQAAGLRSLLFDVEGTFDPVRFVALGGDLTMLDVIRAENVADTGAPLLFGELVFDMLRMLLKHSKRYACVCIDSTGAMVSKAEYEIKEEEGMEKATMTHTARLMSEGLRVVVGSGLLARSTNKITLFFVSQSRDNVGARAMRGIPPPDKVTGGRALRFYASTRVEVSKGETLRADIEDNAGHKDKNIEVAHVNKVRVRKNKCNRYQGRVAEFTIYTEGDEKGLDKVSELVTLGVYTGVVKASGSWYTNSARVAYDFRVQGMDKLKTLLGGNSELFALVYTATREQLATIMDESAQPETDDELNALDSVVDEQLDELKTDTQ